MLQAFAETYSLSLQQTLYQMGARIINNRSEIDEVRFSLPNKHHFLVDLEPFGLKNDNEVYFAADRPYGLIEATVLRDGCEPRIPLDPTTLRASPRLPPRPARPGRGTQPPGVLPCPLHLRAKD